MLFLPVFAISTGPFLTGPFGLFNFTGPFGLFNLAVTFKKPFCMKKAYRLFEHLYSIGHKKVSVPY